jgi:ATP-binding cassette, subfamily C, bacterial LapB
MNSPDTPQQPENLLRSVPMLSASTLLLRNHAIDVDANHLTSGLPLNGEDISEELLNRALKRIGYEAVFTEDIQLQDLIFPCAILLSTGGYLVAIGRSSRTLQVLDGENLRSVRSIPLEHVKAQYDNRSFQILPNMDLLLEQHSVGPEQKHWFWGRLLLKRRSIFDVVLASLFANLLAVVTSLFALQVYDRVIPSQSQPTLWVLASGVGLAILFEAVLRISRAKLIDQVGKEAEIEISSDIFARVLGMKLDKRPASPGAIAHMAREFSAVKEFFTSAAVGVVSDLPFAIVFLLLIYGIAGHVVLER